MVGRNRPPVSKTFSRHSKRFTRRFNALWRLEVAQRLKTQSRALNHGFLRITSCQNTLIRYTDLDALIRYSVVRTLTYEKYTIVLYQPVSRCSRLRQRGHGDI